MTAKNNILDGNIPTSKKPKGFTSYSQEINKLFGNTKGKITKLINLSDAGLISNKELQEKITEIMQEVVSKVGFLLLSKDERDTFNLAVNMFHKDPKKVLEMLKREKVEQTQAKIHNIGKVNTVGNPPQQRIRQKIPYAVAA